MQCKANENFYQNWKKDFNVWNPKIREIEKRDLFWNVKALTWIVIMWVLCKTTKQVDCVTLCRGGVRKETQKSN